MVNSFAEIRLSFISEMSHSRPHRLSMDGACSESSTSERRYEWTLRVHYLGIEASSAHTLVCKKDDFLWGGAPPLLQSPTPTLAYWGKELGEDGPFKALLKSAELLQARACETFFRSSVITIHHSAFNIHHPPSDQPAPPSRAEHRMLRFSDAQASSWQDCWDPSIRCF